MAEDTNTRILMLPGLQNSGPEHWQSRWEAMYPFWRRVNQRNWETPDRREWVATLHQEIMTAQLPVILIAHSLGCALVAWWARIYQEPVKAALLVAPSDVEADDFPSGFKPMPLSPLPFPSIVAASTNDPFVSIAKASQFAAGWGSRLEVLGALGHINADSKLGLWPAGLELFYELHRN